MKDNKELNALNDEDLEDVNAGRMSSGAIAGTVAGAIAGAALLATAIGVPVAKQVKKKKSKKNETSTNAVASNVSAGTTQNNPPAPVTPIAPTIAPVQSQEGPNVSSSVEEPNGWDCSVIDDEPEE